MCNEESTIYPSDYWYCKEQLRELVNAYHSVNDAGTIAALQTVISERIAYVFQTNSEFKRYYNLLMDTTLTRAQFELIFEELIVFTTPMKLPSTKQIEKCFRKVKKMSYPQFELLNPHALSYLGWNDTGTNRKYLIREVDGKFSGLYGTFGTDIIKGHCAICNHISSVGLFLATTKSSGDGTYTKRGNYICSDSNACNQRITDREPMNQFWDVMLGK